MATLIPIPPPTIEDKLQRVHELNQRVKSMEKIINSYLSEGLVIHMKHTSVFDTDLPIHIVASIKTILAEYAESSKQEALREFEELIKA